MLSPMLLAAALGLPIPQRVAGPLMDRDTIAVFPAGTVVPVRFLQRLVAGDDSAGSPILAQTMAALVAHGCIVAPAFTEMRGRITESRHGRWFGGAGRMGFHFDSLRVAGGAWVSIRGVLDSLEFARSGVVDSTGELRPQRHTAAHRGAVIVPLAGAAAVPVAVVPAALFASWSLIRKGARPEILTGEAAAVRLIDPLTLTAPERCQPARNDQTLAREPPLPGFVPFTEGKGGQPGDPVNLVLLGGADDIDTAFARATWLQPLSHSTGHEVKELAAALLDRSEIRAPVSTQYFQGRPQDLAYERPSSTVRVRHHVRFWLLDSATAVWVGAANEDIGLKLEPGKVTATHRISPEIDRERDLIVRELEATGCADLVAYAVIPGAPESGRNATGQPYHSDGRAAFLQFHRCPPP